MSTSREQRLVFGEDPELYDSARPGYSEALVDDVVEFGSIDPLSCDALEIGAGTGKATVAFAARGLRIAALEPDPAMSEVASRRCAQYPAVTLHQATFEDWPISQASVDLVFSGQAWHWVRPEVRCDKAARVLRATGTLALFWHRVEWADADPLRDALEECYRANAPELLERRPGFPGVNPLHPAGHEAEEISASDLFDDVSVRHHRWSETFDAAGLVARLATQSDHRLTDEDSRARLFDGLGALVAAQGGGVTLGHDTVLVLARPAR